MANGFSLARRLRSGDPVYSAWCSLALPGIAELLARFGFPAVTFDQQHGRYDHATTDAGIAMMHAVGAVPIVRIPVGNFSEASRMLDAGAEAVIAPMINTPEDAQSFAMAMKYPPLGKRSWGPHRAIPFSGLDQKGYLHEANKLTFAFAMIETREALRNMQKIIETPGIDGLFVGPSDLSIELTGGVTVDPHLANVDQSLDVVAQVARKSDKIAGAYCASADRAVALSKRGFQFLGVSNETTLLYAGASAALNTLKKQ